MAFNVEFWSNFFEKFQVGLKVWLLTSAGNVLFGQTRQQTEFFLNYPTFELFYYFHGQKIHLDILYIVLSALKILVTLILKSNTLLFISDTKNVHTKQNNFIVFQFSGGSGILSIWTTFAWQIKANQSSKAGMLNLFNL